MKKLFIIFLIFPSFVIAQSKSDYKIYNKASQLFKPEQLLTKEGVAAIVRSMPSRHNASEQVLPGSGASSQVQELINTSTMGVKGLEAGEGDLHTRAHELLNEAHRQKRI